MRIMVVLFLAHSWLFSKQLFTDCLAADFFLTRRTNWKCFFPFSLFFLVMYSMGYYAIGWLTCHLLLLATSTPASPCHSKKVSHFPALVVFIPGFCSCTMYSCCCCCAVFVAHLSALWHLTCFNLCTTTFHYFSYFIQAPAVVLLRILLRFTCCVRCLRTATAAAAVSCHGFRKSISRRRQIIATFLAASLSPIIPTIIQATSV